MGIIPDSNDAADCGDGMKQCSKCGAWLPATTEYFARDKGKKDGLRYDCKACANQSRRDTRRAFKQQTESEQVSVCPDGMKQCRKCGECLPATTEYFARDKKGNMGLHYWCKPCCHQYNNQYKHAHKEEMADYMRRYEEERREERQAYKQQYREENQEYIAEHKREYRRANHVRLLAEKRIYDRENREKSVQRRHKRRAQMKKTGGRYHSSHIAALYALQEGRCCWCGKTMINRIINRSAPRNQKFTVDHIIPIHRGGSNCWWNLILACQNCNASHHARYVFLEWQPPALLEDMAEYVVVMLQLETLWQYWRWCWRLGTKIA